MIDESESTSPRLAYVAISFAMGITAAELLSVPWWWWFAAAIGSAIPGLIVGATKRSFPLFLFCVLLLGAGWATVRLQSVDPHDVVLSSGVNSSPTLIKLVARVQHVDPFPGTSGRVVLEACGLVEPSGGVRPLRGRLVSRLDSIGRYREGERLELLGWLHPPGTSGSASVPGDPDWTRLARLGGYRGRLVVPENSLVRRLKPRGLMDRFHEWRGAVRFHCAEVVASGVHDHRARSLLLALTLGMQGTDWNRIAAPFRRIGVAHLLAISGLHLGIVVGFFMLLIRFLGRPGRGSGWVMIVVVFGYMAIVTWRAPVLRAGLMVLLFSTGLCTMRRLRSTGLLALAAIVLLLINPGDLFLPGFQLSFAVVAFLILGFGTIHRRWFGLPNRLNMSWSSVAIDGVRSAISVAVLAWLTSAPIVLHQFGTVAPLGIIASLLLLPLVVLVLVAAFLRLGLALVGLGWAMPAPLLELPLELVLWVATAIDSLPGSSLAPGRIPAPAMLFGLALVAAWVRFGLRESCWKLRHTLVRRLGPRYPT